MISEVNIFYMALATSDTVLVVSKWSVMCRHSTGSTLEVSGIS